MHLMSQEEYGLRCLVRVARDAGTRPLTIPEIARTEGLSPEYTAKLMRTLRLGKLVKSTRGAGGGYRLSRAAAEITVWEVLQALGGSFFPATFCDTHPGQHRDCVHTLDCSIRSLWERVEGAVREVLEGTTIEGLLQRETPAVAWLEEPRVIEREQP